MLKVLHRITRRGFRGWREVSYIEDPDSPFTPHEVQEERAFAAVARIVWRGEPGSSPGEDHALSLGPLHDGVTVGGPDGAYFWYKDGTVHVVNDAARQLAPRLPQAPAEVTEEGARDSAQHFTLEMMPADVEVEGVEFERESTLALVRKWVQRRYSREGRAARALLRRVKAVYRGCQTYQDCGRLAAAYRDSDGESSREYVFWTAYDRKGLFHYEWGKFGEEENALDLLGRIHKHESGVRFWDVHSDEVTELRSLTGAVHRAVDKHWIPVVTVIPPLLERIRLNRYWVPPMGVVKAPRLLPDADLDGVPCHRVEGSDGWQGTTVLWIDKATHLIRGIDETSVSDDSQSATRIRFLPTIDRSLPPEAFSRVPPGAPAS